MEKGQMTPEGAEMIDQLWKLAGESQAHAQPDAIAAYQLMEELRGLTQYRRLRAMESRERLPGILWAVLIAGGLITVAASCFFGVPNFRFHLVQVVMLTFLISLVLVAIANIDRPYQGLVKVAPEGFNSPTELCTMSRTGKSMNRCGSSSLEPPSVLAFGVRVSMRPIAVNSFRPRNR